MSFSESERLLYKVLKQVQWSETSVQFAHSEVMDDSADIDALKRCAEKLRSAIVLIEEVRARDRLAKVANEFRPAARRQTTLPLPERVE